MTFLIIFSLCINELKIEPNKDASWSLDAGQGVTLESGNYMLHRNDKFYSTTDGSLEIDQVTDDRRGTGKNLFFDIKKNQNFRQSWKILGVRFQIYYARSRSCHKRLHS